MSTETRKKWLDLLRHDPDLTGEDLGFLAGQLIALSMMRGISDAMDLSDEGE